MKESTDMGDTRQDWNPPQIISLDFRKTNGGPFENTYEDDRNYSPVGSP